MAEAKATTFPTILLGLFVGGLLGLGGWFIMHDPLWIAGGLIVGLLGGLFGARGKEEGPPPGPPQG